MVLTNKGLSFQVGEVTFVAPAALEIKKVKILVRGEECQ